MHSQRSRLGGELGHLELEKSNERVFKKERIALSSCLHPIFSGSGGALELRPEGRLSINSCWS